MLVCLTSAKGSPGVSTTALCLAAAGPGAAVVVEADPAGGDLECWTGPHGAAGLVGLATSLRPGMTGQELDSHAVDVVAGVRAVTAPTTEAAMAAVLDRAAGPMGEVLAHVDTDVFVDLGRWLPARPLMSLLGAADLVLVLCRPTLESIEHTRGLVAPGGQVDGAGVPVAVVVVGGARPYGAGEITAALDRPVLGVLPWDPRGVLALVEHGTGRGWRRSVLAAAARDLDMRLRSVDEKAGAGA